MIGTRPQRIGILLCSTLIASSITIGPAHARDLVASSGAIVASGLDHPKNIAFGTDGSLYVAESGHSNGTCPPPTQTQSVTSGANTGAVARIAPEGAVTRVVTGLRSLCNAGDYLGPTAVLPSANGLLILQSACVGAFPIVPNSSCAVSQPLLRLSAGGITHPVAQFISRGNGDKPNVPDEDPFGLAQGPNGTVYVSDGGNNALWRFRPTATGLLFWGANALQEFLVNGVATAPEGMGPLDAVAAAFEATEVFFSLEERSFSRQRQSIIDANPELQEHELIKLATLSAALAGTLRRRGVKDPAASLAAEAGVAVFKSAFERWIDETNQQGFGQLIRESLDELKAVTAGK